jgi:hypothetical protein
VVARLQIEEIRVSRRIDTTTMATRASRLLGELDGDRLLTAGLGGHKPLFAEGVGSIDMDLLEAKTTDRGAKLLRYRLR